jgi:predicted MFS family arabinose efflux permease
MPWQRLIPPIPLLASLTPRGRMLLLILAAALAAGLARDGLVAAELGVRDFLRLPSYELEVAYAAFSFGYYVAIAFSGLIIDQFGTRKSLHVLSIAWAVAMVLTAIAWSLTTLMLFRFALGLAAGGLPPIAVAVFAAWMPPQERGSAMGWVLAAPLIGGMLAEPVVWLADQLGSWRLAFLVFAMGGGLWFVAFERYFLARPGATPTTPHAPPPTLYWRGAIWALALPMLLAVAATWGAEFFLRGVPDFLLNFRHLDIRLSPLMSAVLPLSAIAGFLAGGYGADRILQASGNIKVARQLVPAIGFLGAAITLIYVPVDGEAIIPLAIWLGLGIFAISAAIVPLWVMPIDAAPEHPATAASMIGFAVMAGHLVSPMALARLTGLWRPVTWLGVALLLAAMVAAFLLRPDKSLPVPPPKPEPVEEEAAKPARRGR